MHAGYKSAAKGRSKTEKNSSVGHTAVFDSENMNSTTPMVENRAGSNKESKCLVSGSALFCIHSNGHCSKLESCIINFVNNT